MSANWAIARVEDALTAQDAAASWGGLGGSAGGGYRRQRRVSSAAQADSSKKGALTRGNRGNAGLGNGGT